MALRILAQLALASTLWAAGDAAGTVVASSSSSGTVTINGQTTTFGPSSPTTTTTKGPSGSTTTTHYSSSSPPPADECEHLRICEKCVNGWPQPDKGKACPDSSFCNGAETCNEHAMCVSGTPVDCSKTPFGAIDPQCGRAFCSEADKACKVSITPGNCDDGDPCTDNDTCDPFTGACKGTPKTCKYGKVCSAGICVHPPAPAPHPPPPAKTPPSDPPTCGAVICINGVCNGGACGTCEVCSGGKCVPRICSRGRQCVNDICKVVSTTPPVHLPPSPPTIPDPLAECGVQICVNGKCSGGKCPTCEVCSGGKCVPRVCAAGRVCVNDACMNTH